MVGFVLGPFIFAACMFGMVTQVSPSLGLAACVIWLQRC